MRVLLGTLRVFCLVFFLAGVVTLIASANKLYNVSQLSDVGLDPFPEDVLQLLGRIHAAIMLFVLSGVMYFMQAFLRAKGIGPLMSFRKWFTGWITP